MPEPEFTPIKQPQPGRSGVSLKNILLIIGLIFVLGIITLITLWIASMSALVTTVLEQSGPWLYTILLTLNNVLILPIPNEIFAVSAPFLYPGQEWLMLWLTVAAVSAAAVIDYWGGRLLRIRVLPWLSRYKTYERAERMLQKYDLWVVAITTVTPVPYSLVCWLCGVTRCSFVPFFIVATITRGGRLALVFLLTWGIF